MSRLIFLTHPEVEIDPAVPVPDWPLSARGLARMRAFVDDLPGAPGTVLASAERKARDGAAVIAQRFGLTVAVDPALGENDRTATGYIAPPEFWDVVRDFFARPYESVRGWERAADAQARIVAAVRRASAHPAPGDVIVVSHGGVGTLLCAHLQGVGIGAGDRPSHPGGGCHLVLDRDTLEIGQGWRTIEEGLG